MSGAAEVIPQKTVTRPALAAACLIAGIGALGFNTAPLVNALWVKELLYTADEIGVLSGIQLGGFALGILTSPFWVRKFPLRATVIVGLIGAGGVAAVPFLPSPKAWPLVFAGLGLSSALILAPIVALLGRAAHVERAYGLMYAAQMLLAIVTSLLMSISLVGALGLSGALGLLGAASLVGIVLVPALPGEIANGAKQEQSSGETDWRAIALVLTGILVFLIGMVGIWSFLEVLEPMNGEPGNGRSLIVSASLIAALAGSFSAAWLDDRVGVALPLLAGLAMILSGIALMAMGTQLSLFWIGALVVSFGWNFALAYATAELAHADKSGNLVPLSLGAIGFGGALGTAGLGWVLAAHGTDGFYAVAAITILVGFLCLLSAARLR